MQIHSLSIKQKKKSTTPAKFPFVNSFIVKSQQYKTYEMHLGKVKATPN